MIGVYDYTVWLTYASLACSVIGIMLGCSGRPVQAAVCLLVCAALDAFDGKLARTKKNRTDKEKRYGIQIDSLADNVAFGVLPGAVGYGLFFADAKPWWMMVLYGAAACCIALAALIRLANFNVEEELRQEETSANRTMFTGMPVPFSAGVIPLLAALIRLLDLGMVGFLLYISAMPAIGFLFLSKKLRVPKPSGKGLILLFLAGVAELLLLVCSL